MLQLQIKNCNKDNAETIVDFLEESGALSVTMLDEKDDPILEPELGTMPLWPCVVINALFEPYIDIDAIKNYLDEEYINLQYSLETLPEKDWEKVCLDNFKPKKIGEKLLICPSWLTPTEQNLAVLTLDPGLAFGTGSHETTSLCLSYIEESELADKTVIDYGCGSGILGLAALKLGAKYVYAVDIDEQALIATHNNAVANNIASDKITIATPDLIKDKADLILANILLKTLISLKQDFVHLLHKQGRLIASGVLIDQTDELINAFAPEFRLVKMDNIAEWAVLVFDLT